MKDINIAIIGLGTVGRSVIEYLKSRPNLSDGMRVRAVADSSGGVILDSPDLDALLNHKSSGGKVAGFSARRLFQDHNELIPAFRDAGVEVLVECLPTNIETGQPALSLLEAALRSGLNVVTVDKGPLVHGFSQLLDAAAGGSSRFAFSGTTGVAIPDQLNGDRVVEIRGVLNGTSNFVLTAMQEKGMSFDEALTYAQSEGIAEPDPKLDIEGWDTACKVVILARALMSSGANLSEVSRIGIGPEIGNLISNGRQTGRLVRLVGRARIWQGRVRISVAPKLVGSDSPFYSVSGTTKAAIFRTASGRELIMHGRSGRFAIAQIVLEDVLKVSGQDHPCWSRSNFESKSSNES